MSSRNLSFLQMYLMALYVLCACDHRPLVDINDTHYLRIYVDEEIKNVTCGFYNEEYERPVYERPRVMRVLLADPMTGSILSERYFQNQGEDERGYYIDGYIQAKPGTYNLLLYNFGSTQTLIRNENNFFRMQAYTRPVSEYYLQYIPSTRLELDESRIMQQPEHLFHDVGEPVVIPHHSGVDTLRTVLGDYFKAHSVVLSYYIQVKIKGVEWVKSAVSLMSGMAGNTLMHGHRILEQSDPVNVFFTMKQANRNRRSGERTTTATLYTTFNTFGKIPSVSSVCTLNFEFIKTDGSTQVERLDITPMFDTPLVKNRQWILLDKEIVITPPDNAAVGGGMNPGVDDWKEEKAEIEL